MLNLRGVFTALVTPFSEDGSTCLTSLEKIIEEQISSGISGLVALGTTAETPTLDSAEKDALLKFIIKQVAGRIPVIAGAGTNCTKTSVENSKKYQDAGADGILLVTPYYNKPTQDGIYQHFSAVCHEISIPLVVYNIPGRSAVNISTDTLSKIAALPNVIGVKESSGSMDQIMEVIARFKGSNFQISSGDDSLTLPLIAAGGIGTISVVSNLLPLEVAKYTSMALNGDFTAARELHYELLPFFKNAFIETNPAPIKFLMNLKGMNVGGCRLPLTKLQENSQKLLLELWREKGY